MKRFQKDAAALLGKLRALEVRTEGGAQDS
jgi:hypothetical protein